MRGSDCHSILASRESSGTSVLRRSTSSLLTSTIFLSMSGESVLTTMSAGFLQSVLTLDIWHSYLSKFAFRTNPSIPGSIATFG